MKMRGRLNRTMSVTEPNSAHTLRGLTNTLPNSKNISKQGTYNKDNTISSQTNNGGIRMFQHDNLPQETYFHHNLSSSTTNVGGGGAIKGGGEDVTSSPHHLKPNKINNGTEEVGTMTTSGGGNNPSNDHGPSSKLGSIAMSSSTLPLSLSSMQQNVRTLPLPKLGLSSPWFNAGKTQEYFYMNG